MINKPLLAGSADLTKIVYPVFVSPKLDGIRCLIINGRALSRTFKPIPNDHVRNELELRFRDFTGVYDGELIIEGARFNEISSAIMSKAGEPNFKYVIFDCVIDLTEPYTIRKDRIPVEYSVQTKLVNSQKELEEVHSQNLDAGYEGSIVRSINGLYKQGRSTTKEGILLRIKPLEDSEAEIIGFVEQMHNGNEAIPNEVGTNKRSSKKEFMTPKGTLGALSVRDLKTGVEFELSSGLTQEQRDAVWNNQSEYIKRIVKYEYQSHGSVVKPRSPVFLGFRHIDDLGGE